jgi:hypothetical protein
MTGAFLVAAGLWSTQAESPPQSPPRSAPIDIVVTAAPPLDSQRLADALRTYLDEFGIRVEVADADAAVDGATNAAATNDLRRQLSDSRRIGEAVRAIAVVRAEAGARGAIEIELVDLATEKVLIAQVTRPARDADLYRALALKIESGLRATLSEAPERLGPREGIARLVSSAARAGGGGAGAAAPRPSRLGVETGYALLAFPLAGIDLQGLSFSVGFSPRPWLELTLGSAVLSSIGTEARGVVAVGTVIPLLAAARLRVAGGRGEVLAGPVVEVAYVGVKPSSATTPVRATRDVLPAVGLDVEGRLWVGASAWLFARFLTLGVLVGNGYRVDGQLILDTSRVELAATTGLGVGLW